MASQTRPVNPPLLTARPAHNIDFGWAIGSDPELLEILRSSETYKRNPGPVDFFLEDPWNNAVKGFDAFAAIIKKDPGFIAATNDLFAKRLATGKAEKDRLGAGRGRAATIVSGGAGAPQLPSSIASSGTSSQRGRAARILESTQSGPFGRTLGVRSVLG